MAEFQLTSRRNPGVENVSCPPFKIQEVFMDNLFWPSLDTPTEIFKDFPLEFFGTDDYSQYSTNETQIYLPHWLSVEGRMGNSCQYQFPQAPLDGQAFLDAGFGLLPTDAQTADLIAMANSEWLHHTFHESSTQTSPPSCVIPPSDAVSPTSTSSNSSHQCASCRKQFQRMSDLRRHHKTHTRPNHCTVPG